MSIERRALIKNFAVIATGGVMGAVVSEGNKPVAGKALVDKVEGLEGVTYDLRERLALTNDRLNQVASLTIYNDTRIKEIQKAK